MRSPYDASARSAFAGTLLVPALRPAAVRCVLSIFGNFFMRQYRYALSGRIPVSRVDHPLDARIPFVPSWIDVYLDFVPFWMRVLPFLLATRGRRAFAQVADFCREIGRLYRFAAEVYSRNLSTTDRPFYVARTKFLFVHLLDPHLMCIPSLHVMVAVFAHAKFARIARSLGGGEGLAAAVEEMRRGSLAICRAILFVKQHSVNCIGASLYAMTRFDPDLFSPEAAEDFCVRLFEPLPPARLRGYACVRVDEPDPREPCSAERCRGCRFAAPATVLPPADTDAVAEHIAVSFRRFVTEGREADARGKPWHAPLIGFLREKRQVGND